MENTAAVIHHINDCAVREEKKNKREQRKPLENEGNVKSENVYTIYILLRGVFTFFIYSCI